MLEHLLLPFWVQGFLVLGPSLTGNVLSFVVTLLVIFVNSTETLELKDTGLTDVHLIHSESKLGFKC